MTHKVINLFKNRIKYKSYPIAYVESLEENLKKERKELDKTKSLLRGYEDLIASSQLDTDKQAVIIYVSDIYASSYSRKAAESHPFLGKDLQNLNRKH